MGNIRGVSEDGRNAEESMNFEFADEDDWEPMGRMINKYIISPEPQPRGNPMESDYEISDEGGEINDGEEEISYTDDQQESDSCGYGSY
jgi:hypothetical protein